MIVLLPLLLMQIGPDPHVYTQPPLPMITQHRHDAPVTTAPQPLADPLSECMTRAHADPAPASQSCA